MTNIDIVLPPREGFSPSHFGAIALCVKEFTKHSEYKNNCRILGAVGGDPFAGNNYQHINFKTPLFGKQNKAYSKAILKYLETSKTDLLEIHNRPNLVNYISKKWNGKISLHLHNDPQTMRFAKTAKERSDLIENCSAIYCVSQYIKDRLLEGCNSNTSKAHVVYNGIEDLPTAPNKNKTILFVGRFQPEKGALELAKSLSNILPEFPDWRGVFIGATRHQPNAKVNEYERQVSKELESINSQIELRGFCNYEETIEATLAASIAVIPSKWNEPFGRTALEAMACGCATISSFNGGLKEVIGEATYPIKEISYEYITDALHDLITNADKRINLQKSGIEQANKFKISKVTKPLDTVRKSLLS